MEDWRTQECEQHEHLGDSFPGMTTGRTLCVFLAIRKGEHFPHESLRLKVYPQEKTSISFTFDFLIKEARVLNYAFVKHTNCRSVKLYDFELHHHPPSPVFPLIDHVNPRKLISSLGLRLLILEGVLSSGNRPQGILVKGERKCVCVP